MTENVVSFNIINIITVGVMVVAFYTVAALVVRLFRGLSKDD